MTERIPSTIPAFWIATCRSRAEDTPAGQRPRRPPKWQEWLGHRLLLVLSPRLKRQSATGPPAGMKPYTRLEIERSQGSGTLSALWFPAQTKPRGAVLMVHPWHRAGQGFFYRYDRLRALRQAGYHVLTFDLGGFGQSGPMPTTFHDADLEDALSALRQQAPDLPLHLWSVSAGGYWSHMLLSRVSGVCGAVFEEVPLHLIEWSKRMAPWGMPFYLFFQHVLPQAYRFLDLRNHAPNLHVRCAAYVSGEVDRGVPPGETQELAHLASAPTLLVEGADHLQSFRYGRNRVTQLALETFESAEAFEAKNQTA